MLIHIKQEKNLAQLSKKTFLFLFIFFLFIYLVLTLKFQCTIYRIYKLNIWKLKKLQKMLILVVGLDMSLNQVLMSVGYDYK